MTKSNLPHRSQSTIPTANSRQPRLQSIRPTTTNNRSIRRPKRATYLTTDKDTGSRRKRQPHNKNRGQETKGTSTTQTTTTATAGTTKYHSYSQGQIPQQQNNLQTPPVPPANPQQVQAPVADIPASPQLPTEFVDMMKKITAILTGVTERLNNVENFKKSAEDEKVKSRK